MSSGRAAGAGRTATTPTLPIAAQCRLLKVARSTLYYQPTPVDPDDLALMRRMDELDTKWPFYGSRRMLAALRQDGVMVNRKRVRRLMRVMGLEAIYQKPNTSKGHPDHKVYPYLLRGLAIERPNQVWCADITYIPMAKAFVYLVAVMDWFSRRVLAWRVSITLEADFCVEALQEVIPCLAIPPASPAEPWPASPGMVNPRFSIPIRAFSSPAPGFLTSWRATPSGSAWTARGGSWTTSSSSGCGEIHAAAANGGNCVR